MMKLYCDIYFWVTFIKNHIGEFRDIINFSFFETHAILNLFDIISSVESKSSHFYSYSGHGFPSK